MPCNSWVQSIFEKPDEACVTDLEAWNGESAGMFLLLHTIGSERGHVWQHSSDQEALRQSCMSEGPGKGVTLIDAGVALRIRRQNTNDES